MPDAVGVRRAEPGELGRATRRAENVWAPDARHTTNRGGPSPKRVLPLRSWNEIQLSSISAYAIKGLLPRVGLAVIYGPPKCGKTFFAFDALMHVALGWEYRGQRTKQGPIIYCLFEGQTGFAARKVAFEQRHLSEDAEEPPFFLMPVKMALVTEHQALIEAVKACCAASHPAVVVLDTLNRSISGSESSDEAMTAYVAACDAIREALGCLVIIIHHSGLVAGRARGHTSLLGSADVQIGVKRDHNANVVATVEYMKDGPEGLRIASRLVPVDVGQDEDGDAITSCVVEPCDPDDLPDVSASDAALKKRQCDRTFENAFDEILLRGKTERRPRGDGPVVSAVRTVAVRDEFLRRYGTGEASKLASEESKARAWRRIFRKELGVAYATETDKEGTEWLWKL